MVIKIMMMMTMRMMGMMMMTMGMMIMSIHLFEQYPSSPGLQSELRPPPDHVADHDDADHDGDGDEALPQPSP